MIDPRYLTFRDWADFTRARLPGYDDVPIPAQGTDWKEWALLILRIPSIAKRRPPQPNTFSDWREWAFLFNRAMST
jgi:hypothetical protein